MSTPLTIDLILTWADQWHVRYGHWPSLKDGRISKDVDDTWSRVDRALRFGFRGLTVGSSLPRLLQQHRGVRNHKNLPPLPVKKILRWADAYWRRTGQWPIARSGDIADAPGTTWQSVDGVLRAGLRGLATGSSLARLLAEHHGVPNLQAKARLTTELILTWADAHHRRAGQWPTANTGPLGHGSQQLPDSFPERKLA